MSEFLQTTEARFIVMTAVLAALVAVGVFFLRWARGLLLDEKQRAGGGDLTDLRTLYEQGDLSGEEYQALRNRQLGRGKRKPADPAGGAEEEPGQGVQAGPFLPKVRNEAPQEPKLGAGGSGADGESHAN
jgi:hypothetical protein